VGWGGEDSREKRIREGKGKPEMRKEGREGWRREFVVMAWDLARVEEVVDFLEERVLFL